MHVLCPLVDFVVSHCVHEGFYRKEMCIIISHLRGACLKSPWYTCLFIGPWSQLWTKLKLNVCVCSWLRQYDRLTQKSLRKAVPSTSWRLSCLDYSWWAYAGSPKRLFTHRGLARHTVLMHVNQQEVWNSARKKKKKRAGGSTGYRGVARQKWHFLLLRAPLRGLVEWVKGRERKCHTRLYSLMVGSAHSDYAPHVNTHGPNPRVPRCVLTGLQLSARPAATIIFTHFALPLSSPQSAYLLSFHSSTPPPPLSIFPYPLLLLLFYSFLPSFAVWITPLPSSVSSRPLPLKASTVLF